MNYQNRYLKCETLSILYFFRNKTNAFSHCFDNFIDFFKLRDHVKNLINY
jgi:hypothetical protein